MVVNSNAVLAGVGAQFVPIHANQPIDVALVTAMNILPAEGGDLYVLPSATATPYLFRDLALIDKPRVTINFAPGASIDFAPQNNSEALIRVVAPDFRCIGARVQRTVVDADSERSCFLVEDLTPGSSSTAVFDSCWFDMKQAEADIVGFSCIRARGSPGAAPRRGLTVDGSTFYLRLGVQQSQAWSTSDPLEPHGICAIRASNSAECILTNNRFNGELKSGRPPEAARCGPLICLLDSPQSIVQGNAFRFLSAIALSGQSALVRLTSSTAEGLQAVLMGNMLEGVAATSIFEFLPARDVVVSGSNFGRLTAGTHSGIRAAASPGGIAGDTLVLHGNDYHNIGGSDGHMIDVESTRNVSITNGALGLLDAPLPIAIAPTCSNVWIDPYQAREGG
jgi:hypothetical protein